MTKEEIMALDADGVEKRTAEVDKTIADSKDPEAIKNLGEERASLLIRKGMLMEQVETEKRDAEARAKAAEEAAKKGDSKKMETAETKKNPLEERGQALLAGKSIQIETRDLLVNDALVAPTSVSSDIKGNFGMPEILSQVYVEDHSGEGQHEVPYVKTVGAAGEGTAGTDSVNADDGYGKVLIKPTLIKATRYIDRHIKDRTPVQYAAKTTSLAMYAVYKAAAESIIAKIPAAVDTDAAAMYDTATIAAIDATSLTDLYLGLKPVGDVYGAPVLYCNRKNIQAIGKIRGANEKQKLFSVVYDLNYVDHGTLQDGGTVIRFSIQDSLADNKMLFGIPGAFELDLFSAFTVETDEHERFSKDEIVVRAEAQIGGWLLVFKNAFKVVTIGA